MGDDGAIVAPSHDGDEGGSVVSPSQGAADGGGSPNHPMTTMMTGGIVPPPDDDDEGGIVIHSHHPWMMTGWSIDGGGGEGTKGERGCVGGVYILLFAVLFADFACFQNRDSVGDSDGWDIVGGL